MKYIIPTRPALHIAENLEKKGHNVVYPLKNPDNKFSHPDETFYAKIPGATTLRNVLVLHSGAPSPNDGIVELDFILSILKRNSVNFEVCTLYYPYGRQDHIREDGETAYAEDLAVSIFSRGAKKIYTLDAHFSKQVWFDKYPIENISADALIKAAINDPEAVYLAPDVGAGERFGTVSMSKTRHDSFNVEINSPDALGEVVRNRHVVILDDIISTGGTMISGGHHVLQLGASKITAAATHGVLEGGLRLVHAKFDGNLYVTNTVNSSFSRVDVTPLVEQVLD